MYETIHPGGVFRSDMLGHWARLTATLDRVSHAPPVDADASGELLGAAIEAHAANWDVMQEYSAGRYRDHDLHFAVGARAFS